MAALRDIGEFIREQRRHAQISLRQLAEQAGVSNPYLSQIERGLRKPSAEVLQQIANALRVSTPVMYLRAGLLDTREGQGVSAAIAGDEGLSSRQKQTLTEIYEAFRRENVRADPPPPEPGSAEPGSEPGSTEPGSVDSAPTEPGSTEPGNAESGNAEPGDAGSGDGAKPTARTVAKKAVRKAVRKASAPRARRTAPDEPAPEQ